MPAWLFAHCNKNAKNTLFTAHFNFWHFYQKFRCKKRSLWENAPNWIDKRKTKFCFSCFILFLFAAEPFCCLSFYLTVETRKIVRPKKIRKPQKSRNETEKNAADFSSIGAVIFCFFCEKHSVISAGEVYFCLSVFVASVVKYSFHLESNNRFVCALRVSLLPRTVRHEILHLAVKMMYITESVERVQQSHTLNHSQSSLRDIV